ncbi:MAG: hypothetical protein KGN02_07780 [bacterium]|nr:hypothetical protein [bacterium]
MKTVAPRAVTALVLGLAAAMLPHAALAANRFYGIVRHVSTTNIKVENPRSHETLSFEMWPKFDRIFSRDGKTTYQMRDIKRGRYVEVIYDQKAFGLRHADTIVLY